MSGLASPGAALGCMRLPAGDDATAIAVIHAALDGGARLLDTADVYGGDPSAPHENERLVARALASWIGPRAEVVFATKGGLRREGATWLPDGRKKHLVATAEASAEVLGEPLDLWQWHAVDPRVPVATSLRAIASIASAGVARAIGLCNVGLPVLERALDAMPIASLQVELGLASDAAVRSGVVEAALARGLLVLAHTPLGGAKGIARLGRLAPVAEIATRLGIAPAEVALAWIGGLHPRLIALPGATRVTTAASAARATTRKLDEADVAAMDSAFPRLAALREARRAHGSTPRAAAPSVSSPARGASDDASASEIAMLVGSPAAGKSTIVASLARDGWLVLERDAIGGSLDAIAVRTEQAIAAGHTRVALDATWPTRSARRPIFEVAARTGAQVSAIWIETSLEDAQINACRRLVQTYGKLPDPIELALLAKRDPHAFGPRALFSFRRAFEEPSPGEGFASIDRRAFLRTQAAGDLDPASPPRAILVDLDSALWSSRSGARAPTSPDDLVIDHRIAARLGESARRGALLWATTWQPRVAEGAIASADIGALVDTLRDRLALDLDVRVCPHGAGPPICWCRKPLPGLAVELLHASGLPASSVLAVGRTALDRTAATRLGARYIDAASWSEVE